MTLNSNLQRAGDMILSKPFVIGVILAAPLSAAAGLYLVYAATLAEYVPPDRDGGPDVAAAAAPPNAMP